MATEPCFALFFLLLILFRLCFFLLASRKDTLRKLIGKRHYHSQGRVYLRSCSFIWGKSTNWKYIFWFDYLQKFLNSLRILCWSQGMLFLPLKSFRPSHILQHFTTTTEKNEELCLTWENLQVSALRNCTRQAFEPGAQFGHFFEQKCLKSYNLCYPLL